MLHAKIGAWKLLEGSSPHSQLRPIACPFGLLHGMQMFTLPDRRIIRDLCENSSMVQYDLERCNHEAAPLKTRLHCFPEAPIHVPGGHRGQRRLNP